jgi:hypothetical protein
MLLLHMQAAPSLTLTFEELLPMHKHAVLSLTLKLERLLLLLHRHAALLLKAAPQVQAACR